ncbi:hypothetical protein QEN19_003671 [Hanseniaspora menglaensis]
MPAATIKFSTVQEVESFLKEDSSKLYFNKKIDLSAERTPFLNHTCLRIKDPAKSIPFYTDILGFKLVDTKRFPEWKFDLFFLSLNKDLTPKDIFNTDGILELTHNYGTEDDESYEVNNGNDESKGRGFGHICLTTFDIQAMEDTLISKGVEFKKKLADGRQKDICFIYDPDKYWIELVCYGNRENHLLEKELLISKSLGNQFNHTMIRVKDPVKSLSFYINVLGMQLLEFKHHPNANFTVYFLAYPQANASSLPPRRTREGILELTHNWGTEDDAKFSYHNGNDNPQGFGHTCVTFADASRVCSQIDEVYGDKVQWAPKWGEGGMKNIAFIKDPDGYKVEFVNQQGV